MKVTMTSNQEFDIYSTQEEISYDLAQACTSAVEWTNWISMVKGYCDLKQKFWGIINETFSGWKNYQVMKYQLFWQINPSLVMLITRFLYFTERPCWGGIEEQQYEPWPGYE